MKAENQIKMNSIRTKLDNPKLKISNFLKSLYSEDSILEYKTFESFERNKSTKLQAT